MISLCQLDLAHSIMSLSHYCHAPQKGHLDHLMRVCSYVRKFPQATVQIHTGIPNHKATFGEYPEQYDWMETVYRSSTEELPQNMPTPKGKLVCTMTYFDTNLMHDVITGRSASGVHHFLNQTPWEWFSKHQAQAKTATYGSEFMAACQAIEQIMDIHYTLRMFGVLIDGASWLFGDNKSVVREGESNEQEGKPLHPQKSQNKNLSLTHLLKMKMSQIQLKHFKFIMV